MAIFQKAKKNGGDIKITESSPVKKDDIAVKSDEGRVLLVKHPWTTEKSGNLANLRKYVFVVDKKANKSEILKNIELAYKVKVSFINIINIKGKIKRMRTGTGKIPGRKKAIITLKEGYKIETMTI